LIILLLIILSVFLFIRYYQIESENSRLVLEQEKTQNFVMALQNKINDLLDETQGLRNDVLLTTTQTDNPNLLSALSTVSSVNRFLPDFMPIRNDYAISQSYSNQHQSIDFSTSKFTVVHAAGAGVVVACYEDNYLGNVILIDHLNSFKTLYAHLERFNVSINTFVEKGQEIAQVGNTGNSTNPHLHFQLFYENDPIDPNKIMKISKFKN
jgi:murein DD-endopeptidase MepM/ murein hydrolase activator NlpD